MSAVVKWRPGIISFEGQDNLDVCVLTIDGRVVLRAISPPNSLADPVSEKDKKLIVEALTEYADLKVRLAAAEQQIQGALGFARTYAHQNPKHFWMMAMQDPDGVHAWLEANDPQHKTGG